MCVHYASPTAAARSCPVGAAAVRPARYPATANRGARGLILTRVFAVTLALDWVPAVVLALALMA